jgi:hypothetical protein
MASKRKHPTTLFRTRNPMSGAQDAWIQVTYGVIKPLMRNWIGK